MAESKEEASSAPSDEGRASDGPADERPRALETANVGESERSLNLLEAHHPPTRAAPWAAATATATTARTSQEQSQRSLLDIMKQEQEQADAAKRAAIEADALLSEREQEEQLMILAMERSMADINAAPEGEAVAEAAQEEEMIRLAMEMSLSEVGGNQSFSLLHTNNNNDSPSFAQQQPPPATPKMQVYSENHASATVLDFAQKVQAESETTEGFIESPHLSRASSKRILIRPPSLGSISPRQVTPKATPKTVAAASTAAAKSGGTDFDADLSEASKHLSNAELEQIAKALRESEEAASNNNNSSSSNTPTNNNNGNSLLQAVDDSKMPGNRSRRRQDSFSSVNSDGSGPRLISLRSEQQKVAAVARLPVEKMVDEVQAHISAQDTAEIERALREADEEEERKSVLLALQMLEEENRAQAAATSAAAAAAARRGPSQPQGNVRTMTRAELEQQNRRVGAFRTSSPPRMRHPLEEEGQHVSSGFRMNANNPQQWSRRDQNSIVGPNNEVRTKHDTSLQGLANAHRLGLNTDEDMDEVVVGNKAYNSFMKSVRRTKKGVATQGTGRAGSDADTTKGGAMDPAVRIEISRAVNNGLIEKCNGVVKEGKEAIVYHADKGAESGGFDVAVKVFKRIQEFRARGDYVDGDPRYARSSFRNASSREQLSLWAEKEMRNLVRANRSGVPVPTPLLNKENILFMRFLGADGWPAPQLREVNLRRGSKRWVTLYNQVIEAMKYLYQGARLVHGDLSEYNILVVPASLVENRAEGTEDNELQPVLIDFGQAVDIRHPEALGLLERDMERVQSFFSRVGVEALKKEVALSSVLGSEYPCAGAAEAMERLNWAEK